MRKLFSKVWAMAGLLLLGLPPSLALGTTNGTEDPNLVQYGFEVSMDASNPEQPLTMYGQWSLESVVV